MSVKRLALGDRLQTIERCIACTCHPGTHSGLLCFTTSSLYHSYSSIRLYFLPFFLSEILFSTSITSVSFVLCPCTCDHMFSPMFLSLCGYISFRCDWKSAELHIWGRDNAVGIATSYGLEGSGIESWWGRDFTQIGSGAHPVSQTESIGSLSGGVNWPGLGVDHPLLLAPRLKKE